MNDNGIYRFFRQAGTIFALVSCSQANKSDEKTHTPVIKYVKEDTRRSAVPSSVTDNTTASALAGSYGLIMLGLLQTDIMA